MLGLRFCARAFSSCSKWGPLFIAVRGPLTVAAPLVAERRLQTRRLSSCGSRAQLLRGTWDLPRPGLEPVSPALAGRFLTTALPGKPQVRSLIQHFTRALYWCSSSFPPLPPTSAHYPHPWRTALCLLWLCSFWAPRRLTCNVVSEGLHFFRSPFVLNFCLRKEHWYLFKSFLKKFHTWGKNKCNRT